MSSQKHEYIPVSDSEQYLPNIPYKERRVGARAFFVLSIAISVFASTLGGFFAGTLYAGKYMKHRHTVEEGPVHLDPVTIKFTSNRAFLQHPSNATEELWKTLYPKDTHGLFEYPDDHPERTGFAAFHQLHCVDALRRGYYQREDTIEALKTGQKLPEFEREVDETHYLHCIEFLRQSVMCHADATMQTEAEYHQGILAFGVEYQCKNWWQLVDWVDQRNAAFPPSGRFDSEDIHISLHDHGHEHHDHGH